MTDLCLIYATFPDAQTAEEASKTLLGEKLIACVNIMPAGMSLYHWEGKIKKAQEVVVFMKTVKSGIPKIQDLLTANHTYQCPCLVSLPIEDGLPDFLQWMVESTKTV